jgi:hypothetical protein
MTGGNGKPLRDRTPRPDWFREDADGARIVPAVADHAADSTADRPEPAFSVEARMAHELVSLFLSITDHDVRERCLAVVREMAESSGD